jgi:hypothetical protein
VWHAEPASAQPGPTTDPEGNPYSPPSDLPPDPILLNAHDPADLSCTPPPSSPPETQDHTPSQENPPMTNNAHLLFFALHSYSNTLFTHILVQNLRLPSSVLLTPSPILTSLSLRGSVATDAISLILYPLSLVHLTPSPMSALCEMGEGWGGGAITSPAKQSTPTSVSRLPSPVLGPPSSVPHLTPPMSLRVAPQRFTALHSIMPCRCAPLPRPKARSWAGAISIYVIRCWLGGTVTSSVLRLPSPLSPPLVVFASFF